MCNESKPVIDGYLIQFHINIRHSVRYITTFSMFYCVVNKDPQNENRKLF